jgi:hypothetical protein
MKHILRILQQSRLTRRAPVRAAQVQRFALRTRGDEAALPILSTTVRSSMASLDDDYRQPQPVS